ncbi:murein L,D-transpeptidase family protein [Hymenobacter sp. IS2118]|uniref:L,D-transpeptidase family protein n=1 Tax=Hymenobacter sp. IS2118 TaxID=1505605 RepID=UPI00190F4BD7|nr:L,D-transpeptidase family protein [Hymenobacter sp. IS2118]
MLPRLSCCLLVLLSFTQLLAQSCTPPVETETSGGNLPGTKESAFWQQQLRFPRVRVAYAAAGPGVANLLRTHYLDARRLEIMMRAIKTNRELEVWARNQNGGPFELLQTYPLAATSGKLGPKRRAGDYQVPEGFYEIDRFNPKSDYHLSLGLNYPNAADRALGEPHPGGDIFIHGGEVTIGCLPITDAGIEEVYLLAVAAQAAGQAAIPVHIFPFPLTEPELAKRPASPHAAFWRGLMPGYAYFEQHHDVKAATQPVASE